MKTHIQKLPLEESTSFVARTYRTPNFEVGWHQHEELELILFTEGFGLSFVGDHIGEFETGDIYFIGSNLPHTFQKHLPDMVTSAVVVQFRADFWGAGFLELPESKLIRTLFAKSNSGLKLGGTVRKKLRPLIRSLETAAGFERILFLGKSLQLLAMSEETEALSIQQPRAYSMKDKELIERIYAFTLSNFQDKISLQAVSDLANLSVSAFCNYFKRSTKKTYLDFLTEIRIGHACNLLSETSKPVRAICLESGFNSEVNFHKQFLKLKSVTPLQFRNKSNAIMA